MWTFTTTQFLSKKYRLRSLLPNYNRCDRQRSYIAMPIKEMVSYTGDNVSIGSFELSSPIRDVGMHVLTRFR